LRTPRTVDPVELIAEVCHEACRVVDKNTGDGDAPPKWRNMPSEARSAMVRIVGDILRNPTMDVWDKVGAEMHGKDSFKRLPYATRLKAHAASGVVFAHIAAEAGTIQSLPGRVREVGRALDEALGLLEDAQKAARIAVDALEIKTQELDAALKHIGEHNG